MPCDFPRVHTLLLKDLISDFYLALTEPVDCPRASCDLGIKYLLLRSHALDLRVCPGS